MRRSTTARTTADAERGRDWDWDEGATEDEDEDEDEWEDRWTPPRRQTRKRQRWGVLWALIAAVAVCTAMVGTTIVRLPTAHDSTAPQAGGAKAPPVITLFAPDDNSQSRRNNAGPLDASLPQVAAHEAAGLLPPDKPSDYEMGLITAVGTPEKAIVVSRASQTMHVYQSGVFLAGTYVITGRPQLPTPTGVYHIFYKLAPATLYSPWLPGSPFWYPPTPVNYTMEFKGGGFLIHDAPWHHVWGPGMNDWHYDPGAQEWQWGSHGCVSAPTPFVKWLYDWSPEGTTVIIY